MNDQSPAGAVVAYVAPVDELDTADQRRAIIAWGNRSGIPIAGAVQEEHTTGRRRAGLVDVLNLVRLGEAPGGVVIAAARIISADPIEFDAFRWILSRNRASLHTVEPYEPGDVGHILAESDRQRQAWMYEYAHQVKLDRVRSDPAEYYGGGVPFGFQVKGSRLAEDLKEMTVVRRIEELRRAGTSRRAIAGILSAEGYRTKRGSEKWGTETVRRVMTRHGIE